MFYENLAKEAPNVAARALLHTRREEAQPAAKEQLGVRGGFRATSGRAAARYALRWRGGRVAALGLSAAELFPGPSDFLTYKPETGSGRANRGVLRRLPGNDFASLRLPGRDLIFLLYLRAIMIPFVMFITPHCHRHMQRAEQRHDADGQRAARARGGLAQPHPGGRVISNLAAIPHLHLRAVFLRRKRDQQWRQGLILV